MSTLTRQELLDGIAKSRKTEMVEVPALGGSVAISELTGRQRIELFTWVKSMTPDGQESADVMSMLDFRERLLSMTLRDQETGSLLFSPEDIPTLSELGDSLLNSLSEVARNLSGIGDETIEKRAADPNSSGA
jgi:hypothetical protein